LGYLRQCAFVVAAEHLERHVPGHRLLRQCGYDRAAEEGAGEKSAEIDLDEAPA